VDGERVDVYTRYDVSVAGTTVVFGFVITVESGAYIAHIEVVQTDGSSTSSSYIVHAYSTATRRSICFAYLVQRAPTHRQLMRKVSSWDNTALETCRPSI
jgi:hypothetical protein